MRKIWIAALLGAITPVSRADTWNGGTGNWNVAANWSGGVVPDGAMVDVAIDGGKAVLSDVFLNTDTTVRSLTIDAADALRIGTGLTLGLYGDLLLNGTLDATGATIDLRPSTGTIGLRGGIVRGGTVLGAGTALTVSLGGTLDRTTLNTNVNVTSGDLFVQNGLTLDGTLALTSTFTYRHVSFQGNTLQTLGGSGTIQSAAGSALGPYIDNVSGARATLGQGITVDATLGGVVYGAITNNGTISASTSGKLLSLLGNTAERPFVNNGTINVTNGAKVALNWFSNTGTINVTNSAVEVGNTTTASIGTIHRSGTSTVTVNGPIDNTNDTLNLNANTGSWNLYYGSIKNGAMATTGGAKFVVTPGSFDGFILENVQVTAGSSVLVNGTLYVIKNMKIDGTVDLDRRGAILFNTSVPQTIGGTGRLRISPEKTSSENNLIYNQGPAAVTFGPDLTIESTVSSSFFGLMNSQGSIRITSPGNVTSLEGDASSRPFTNSGTISIEAGTTLQVSQFINNGVIDDIGGTIEFKYRSASEKQTNTVRQQLEAAYGTNFSTGPLRSSAAVAGVRGLGFSDQGLNIRVRAALYGDADLNGKVDFNDFLALQNHFGQAAFGFNNGNFNYDGVVDFNDFLMLQNNFGQSLSGVAVSVRPEEAAAMAAFAGAAGVPEPAACALLVGAVTTLVRRRRII